MRLTVRGTFAGESHRGLDKIAGRLTIRSPFFKLTVYKEGFVDNRFIKVLAFFAVAGLAAAGPVAYAGSEGNDPEGGKSYQQDEAKEFIKALQLTPEQAEKVKAQREAKKESYKAVREELKAKTQALHEAIAKPGTKRADVNELVGEVNALKGQMFSQQIDGIFAMKEILTPEQFAKMKDQRKEAKDKADPSFEKTKG